MTGGTGPHESDAGADQQHDPRDRAAIGGTAKSRPSGRPPSVLDRMPMPGGIVGAWANVLVCGCLGLGAAWALLFARPAGGSRGDVAVFIMVLLIAAGLETVFIRQVVRETRARRAR